MKTAVETRRIPTIAENVAALETSARTARTAQASRAVHGTAAGGTGGTTDPGDAGGMGDEVYAEARALVEAVLELDPDPGRALLAAFRRGLLDVPYCLHPDNPGRSAGFVDERGRLAWSSIGAMPIGHVVTPRPAAALTSGGLLDALHYVGSRLDIAGLDDLRTARAISVP